MSTLTTSLALLWALAACGGKPTPAPEAEGPVAEAPAVEDADDADTDKPSKKKNHKGPGVMRHGELPPERALVNIADLPEGEPSFVVLIVMDTVRADHTALCGYERPNSPTLLKIKDNAKAWTCDAYSPATWTMPAHASYFTGRPTAEHGVHTLGTPLREDFTTLAEDYAERGYQTLFVSANPVFGSKDSGFWQGFDRVVVAEALRGPLRDELGAQLKDEFAKLDNTKPLFLVLNIFDAHDPYPEVPEGLDWVPKQARFSLKPHTANPSNAYFQYVTGKMPEEKKPAYLEKIRNAYDHAVFVADANLGVAIKGFQGTGWLARKHRIVITSDHGEHLGEHGLLRHGSATWQTVTQVPFLYFDNLRTEPLDLPRPVSATAAFDLLTHGRLPDPALPVSSASAINPDDFKPSWVTVSVWDSPTDKLMYFDGDRRRYDLQADPGEANPLPLPEVHPALDVLAEELATHEQSLQDALDRPPDPAVLELLKSVGYVH